MAKRKQQPEDGPRDPGELHEMEVSAGEEPVFGEVDLMCGNCDYEVTRPSTSGFYDNVCPRCGSDMFDMDVPDTDPPDEPHAP